MKKHYTKILAILCIAILITFASCGKSKNKDTEQDADSTQHQTETMDVYYIDAAYTIKEAGYKALLQIMIAEQNALQYQEEYKDLDLREIMLSKETLEKYARAYKIFIKFNNDGTVSLSYNDTLNIEENASQEMTNEEMFYYIDEENCLYMCENSDFNPEDTDLTGYFSDDFGILYITQYDTDNTGLILPLELV